MPPPAPARPSRPARCRRSCWSPSRAAWRSAHDPEAADAALAQAIEAGDTAIELRIARARLAEERGRTDLALRHWQRVLGLAADHLDGRLGMVRALRAEARFTEAERLCRELLTAAPKDTRPAAELARIAQDAGDPVAAEHRWHDALLASPGQLAALLGLAQALTAQHRFPEARAILAELGAREPGHPRAGGGPGPHPAGRGRRRGGRAPSAGPGGA